MGRLSAFWALACLVCVACTTQTVATTVPVITSAAPVTSGTKPTTAPTTTLPPPPVVRVALESAPEGLDRAVADLYAWALDPRFPPPPLPGGLVDALGGKPHGPRELRVTGEASSAEVLSARLAVVEAGDDVVLAVDRGGGWRIVGARLARLGLPPWYGETPRLLMIIGSDARPGQNPLKFRADSLHILGIDSTRNRASLLGIPRDTLVTKLDGTQDKLTHAMSSQGPGVLTETAENLTGLELDGYLVTGFKGFIDVVDAFGGFTFDVPFGITDEKAEADFRRGTQQFSGEDALAWSRIRHISGGDFQRQLNGGDVLLAMLTEAREGAVTSIDVPAMLGLFTRFVATDLSPEDLLTMAVAVVQLDPSQIDNVVVPGTTSRAVGRSVVLLDMVAFQMFRDISDGVLDGDYSPFP